MAKAGTGTRRASVIRHSARRSRGRAVVVKSDRSGRVRVVLMVDSFDGRSTRSASNRPAPGRQTAGHLLPRWRQRLNLVVGHRAPGGLREDDQAVSDSRRPLLAGLALALALAQVLISLAA